MIDAILGDSLPLAQRTERLGPNETDPGSSPGRETRRHDARSAMGRLSSFQVGEVGSSPTRATVHFGVVQRQDAGLLPPLWQFESARRSETGPCSSMGERLPYKQDGGGSNPSAGTVTVVYRRCIPDRDSGGPGSTPGGHPRWVRHRW
jgi:hypothetical protein